MVCLIASTSGSCTASRRKASTPSKLSNGWWISTSPRLSRAKNDSPGVSCTGYVALYDGNSSSGRSTRSISCVRRARFTGPWTRYKACDGRPNWRSRKPLRNSEQPADTSSRTAWPKCRCTSPWRKAVRKLSTSSSSTDRSEWRVTRNCENCPTSRPGNRSARCERMTLDSETNSVRPSDTVSGMRMKRGSTRGTFTMAISLARPNASLPPRRTMKFSDLLATCGNGCDGSSPTGISSGLTSRWKYAATQRCCAGVRSPCDTMRMPRLRNAGSNWSL